MDQIDLAMTDAEGVMLRNHLHSTTSYLEFGAGGSTLAAVRAGIGHIASVEGDPEWIKRLRAHPEIAEAERSGVLTFHYSDIGEIAQWGMPRDGKKQAQWPGYYLDIWRRLPTLPDLVLIDGRFRAACFAATLLNCDTATRILMHDFYRHEVWRRNYQTALQLAKIEEHVENLVRLQPLETIQVADIMSVLSQVWVDFA